MRSRATPGHRGPSAGHPAPIPSAFARGPMSAWDSPAPASPARGFDFARISIAPERNAAGAIAPVIQPMMQDGSDSDDDGRERKYPQGTHGYKRTEQKDLTDEFGEEVSGKTHQSEHPIGAAVLLGDLKRGKSTEAREEENAAPAYQEQLGPHRGHIGTGNRGPDDATGMSSAEYREAQDELVGTEENPGAAIQINQLGYAPVLQEQDATVQSDQADKSFEHMVENTTSVPYHGTSVAMSPTQQAEALLSRTVAKGLGEGPGGFPSEEQEKEAKEKIGVGDDDEEEESA